MNPIIKQILYYIVGICVATFIYEHTAREIGWTQRPSLWLHELAIFLSNIFEIIGQICAIMGSYLIYIRVERLWITFVSLAVPTSEIALSWMSIFVGYLQMAKTYDYPILVAVGSAILVTITAYIIYRYWTRIRVALYRPSVRPDVYVPADRSKSPIRR